MITAIDTNVLVDILWPDPAFEERSKAALGSARQSGALIVCEVVFSEIVSVYGSPDPAEQLFQDTGIVFEPSNRSTLARAGIAWREFSVRRGTSLICSACGAAQAVACSRCLRPIRTRQHVLADFLIAAHAANQADRLVTRDQGFYRSYFPDVELLAP